METTIETTCVEEVGQFASKLSDAFSQEFVPSEQASVVRVPGRLDVMGGIAEYTGSVTLSATTSDAVFAAAAPREDQNIVVDALDGSGNGHDSHSEWALREFYHGLDQLADPDTFFERIGELGATWVRPAAAALYTLLQNEIVPHFAGGMTLVFHSTLPSGVEVGRTEAVESAAMLAAARTMGCEVDPMRVAEMARAAARRCAGHAEGLSGVTCSLLGRSDALIQARCQPSSSIGPLRLPEGVTVVGIDCGYRHPAAERKYIDARVTAFMGKAFVERVMQAGGAPPAGWNGHLAQITVSDYVNRYRDRIPTKMKGQAFLERFSDTGCPHAQVRRDAVYKIRSRTEHHIYENDRVHQFIERLSRAARTGDRNALVEAGELMYASHWSYGQRCGLGTVPTDTLVNRLRQRGPAAGVFGARVSANGAGGVVVALVDRSPETRNAVADAVREYQNESGHTASIIDALSPGGLVTGVRPLS